MVLQMWTCSIKFSANTYNSTQIVFSPNMVGKKIWRKNLEGKNITQIIYSRIEDSEIKLNTAIKIDVLPTGGHITWLDHHNYHM